MNKKRLLPVILSIIVLCIATPLAAQETKTKKQPSEKVQKDIEYLYTGKRQEARFFRGYPPIKRCDACFYLSLSDMMKQVCQETYFETKGLYGARGDKEGVACAGFY